MNKGKSLRPSQGSRVIIAIGIGAVTLLMGVYVERMLILDKNTTSKIASQSSTAASVADPHDQTTIIVSTPNTSDCRRAIN
jgi:hypothetical protein